MESLWADHCTLLIRGFRKIITAFITTIMCTNLVICAWDIRLSCPETWIDRERITLVCEINKQRLNICTTKTQNTEFRLENDNHLRQMCNVDPFGYATCNQAAIPNVTQCVCNDNSTYFSIHSTFIADKSMHNGTWDCNRPCLDDPLIPDILVKNNSPNCFNVKVLGRDENKTNEAPVTTTAFINFWSCMVALLVIRKTIHF